MGRFVGCCAPKFLLGADHQVTVYAENICIKACTVSSSQNFWVRCIHWHNVPDCQAGGTAAKHSRGSCMRLYKAFQFFQWRLLLLSFVFFHGLHCRVDSFCLYRLFAYVHSVQLHKKCCCRARQCTLLTCPLWWMALRLPTSSEELHMTRVVVLCVTHGCLANWK